MSPHQWLLKYKLELAHRIIEEREVPVTELTKLCGLNNTSHFIHRFRKRYGISPARLSKQLRTEGAETENIHNEEEHK
jgi:AraC-like DNA-binding protein